MTTTVVTPNRGGSVGELLRDWRKRRRRSQLDLALDADVSARHLSFVETGRSRPSRELLLHLAGHLDVPLREQNTLLLAAGYAPRYPERPLDDQALAPVRHALDKVLAGHHPFPAVVVDRQWNLVSANQPATAVLTEGVAPELITPPANTLRVALHPDGLAPRIVNLAEYSAHLLHRLRQQAVAAQDRDLDRLYDELRSYPGVEETSVAAARPEALVFSPLRIRAAPSAGGPGSPRGPGDHGCSADGPRELAFFSTLATFGTAVDVTVSELAIESFFPADQPTARALHAAAGEPERAP
jgi:transcriptional regulator with XRE-family HTH domain